MKNFLRNRICTQLQSIFLQNTFLIMKGNFTVEKPGRYQLKLEIKVNIMKNRTNQNCTPPDKMQ